MKIEFKNWLVSKGYKEFSASGNRSTAIDYPGRIERVCMLEKLTWDGLAKNISKILPQYETAGEKQTIGKRSHESVVNALRQFKKFIISLEDKGVANND